MQLTKSLPRSEYAVLNDVLLPYKIPIRTSQIDHIVVSIFGIFCIETKSHAGWIFGSKAGRIFTQVLYRNKYRITPNPVEQNSTHIHALSQLLGAKIKVPIVNIVVFPSADKFIIDGYENVGSTDDLIETISSYNDRVYKYAEAKEIIELIGKYNFKHPVAHAQHAERVKAFHAHA